MPRLLDLCAGELGWSRVFAARGWECVCVDVKRPSKPIPDRCRFVLQDLLALTVDDLRAWMIDAVVASTPCEQFSVHGLTMWHPNPPYPKLGMELFEHAGQLCETAGLPHVLENVRSAQQFVGPATNHCGPFYLWGSAVPPIMPQGISKGSMIWSPRYRNMKKSQRKAEVAMIPELLANCVAEYMERLIEAKMSAC